MAAASKSGLRDLVQQGHVSIHCLAAGLHQSDQLRQEPMHGAAPVVLLQVLCTLCGASFDVADGGGGKGAFGLPVLTLPGAMTVGYDRL